MNLTGNGYNLSADFQQDEQLERQFPQGGALPDTPNAVHGHEYVRCVLPCPNPHCAYYGWLETGEFVIGTPGWDCETFLETLLSRAKTRPIEPPDLRTKPRVQPLTTHV